MQILKQAEQYPWRLAVRLRQIHRGYIVRFPDSESHQRMLSLLDANPNQARDELLNTLTRQGGLGTHWTSHRQVADQYTQRVDPWAGRGSDNPPPPGSLGSGPYQNALGVHLTASWNREGEDPNRTNVGGNPSEHEIPLLPGVPLQLKHMRVKHVPPQPQDGSRWEYAHHELPFSPPQAAVT